MIPLICYLEKIEDPRKARGKRYNLVPILVCCFLATMCGYKNYSGFADFCKNYKDSLSDILEFKDKNTPCAATFFNIIKSLGVQNVEKIISEWVESLLDDSEAIAILRLSLSNHRWQNIKRYKKAGWQLLSSSVSIFNPFWHNFVPRASRCKKQRNTRSNRVIERNSNKRKNIYHGWLLSVSRSMLCSLKKI